MAPCFPAADAVRIVPASRCHGRRPLDDGAFALLAGVRRWLDVSGCSAVTDAAFAHLAGMRALHVSDCGQLTEAFMQHLGGIESLSIVYDGVTDAAFAWPAAAGLKSLAVDPCTNLSDAAFARLSPRSRRSKFTTWSGSPAPRWRP